MIQHALPKKGLTHLMPFGALPYLEFYYSIAWNILT